MARCQGTGDLPLHVACVENNLEESAAAHAQENTHGPRLLFVHINPKTSDHGDQSETSGSKHMEHPPPGDQEDSLHA